MSSAVVAHAAHVLGLCLILGVAILFTKIVYNLYFHPLAKYPGPKLAAISDIPYCYSWVGGHIHQNVDELHRKYGPVVRTAPNDLSFATVAAHKDIFSHPKPGKPQFLKSIFYDVNNADPGIISLRQPDKHRVVRKDLSHAFSAAALREQEGVVLQFTNLFVSQLLKMGGGEEGVEVNSWFNWLTFDIIGDLAFGESFNAVANAPKPHFWVSMVGDSTFARSYMDVYRRLPWAKAIIQRLFIHDPQLMAKQIKHNQYTLDAVKRRLADEKGNERLDFFGHLLKKKDGVEQEKRSIQFFQQNASNLIIAGSETTATFLAGVTYHLLANPKVMKRLTEEIRGAFLQSEDINGDAASKLPYLHAVMEEGLRIFPPVSFGVPRISPGAEVDGHYVPAGTSISVAPWTLTRSEAYWHAPLTFAPERWLPATHKFYDPVYASDNRDASKPFSAGPRGCLGINLAYLEMRIILSKLIWRFDFEFAAHKDRDLDWDRDTEVKLLWKKPDFHVRFVDVRGTATA